MKSKSTKNAKPELDLERCDGNAYAIMSAASRAAKRAGWDQQKIDKVMDECRKSDYDHLLQTILRYFEVTMLFLLSLTVGACVEERAQYVETDDAQACPVCVSCQEDAGAQPQEDGGQPNEDALSIQEDAAPASCTDDPWEPNNTEFEASAINPGVHMGTYCPGDDDWFSIGEFRIGIRCSGRCDYQLMVKKLPQ